MICKICLKNISTPEKEKYKSYHNSCIKKLFGSLKVSPYLNFNKTDFLQNHPEAKVKGMSISGVQPKLCVNIDDDSLNLLAIGGKYILKPTPPSFPFLSENEHLSMTLGKLFKIDTPPLGLINFSDGEQAYLIKRFDRSENSKIHQEDMTQILGIHRDKNGQYKYDSSYEDVAKKIKEINNQNLAITLKFFKRLIFNFIINNGDYHLKNISLQSSIDGKYNQLTPNYDSINTRLYFPNETEMALDFLHDDELTPTRKKPGYYSRADFDELARRLELNEKATKKLYTEFINKKDDAITLINNSFLPDEFKENYQKQMAQRLEKLMLSVH